MLNGSESLISVLTPSVAISLNFDKLTVFPCKEPPGTVKDFLDV